MKWKNWLWHLVAWLGFWGALILSRGREGAEWPLILGSLACFVVVSTVLSYVNYGCLERFLDRQRYGAYFLRMVPFFFLGQEASNILKTSNIDRNRKNLRIRTY